MATTNSIYGETTETELGSNVVISKTIDRSGVKDDIDLFYTPPTGMDNPFWVIYEDVIRTSPTLDKLSKEEKLRNKTLDSVSATESEKKSVLNQMKANIGDFRELIVCELAPAMLSVEQAWSEASEVLRQITKAEDMQLDDLGVKRIMEQAFKLKIITKLGAMLSLSNDEIQLLVQLTFAKQGDSKPNNSAKTMQDIIREALDGKVP